jgi:predicted CXXCH cytochrome family protein
MEIMTRTLLDIFLGGMALAGILIAPIYGCSKHAKDKLATFHSPYAERHCTQCHLPPNIGSSQKLSPEEPTSIMGAKLSPNPWLLALPLDQLCTKCHRYDTSRQTVYGKLWIHAPSALGACIVCHSPHLSEYPYMLRRQSIRLCTDQCHSEGYMLETEVHTEPRHCLECHNPHIGMNARMLKKDFQEVWLEPKTPWVKAGAGVKQ